MRKVKITDPSKLKEGMRVQYKEGGRRLEGVLEKSSHGRMHVPDHIYYMTNVMGEYCGGITDVYQILDEPRTIDDLEKGDLIETIVGFRRCLSVSDEVYHLSRWDENPEHDDLNRHGGCWTIFEMKERGWKLYQPESEEVVELTLEEVAELKGVSVDKIRIKE